MKQIKNLLKKRKLNKKIGSINKKVILLNAVGFSVVLFMSLNESHLYVQLLLSLYVLINILIFIFWRKIQSDLDMLIYSLNAFISFVTSFDYRINNSKYVYIIYFLIGLFFTAKVSIKIIQKAKGRRLSQEE